MSLRAQYFKTSRTIVAYDEQAAAHAFHFLVNAGREYPQHGGMSRIDPQEHYLAGHSNLHMAPLQAPLHVMRNSFNRLARSEAEQAGGYPQAQPSGPSSFPPSCISPRGQEHHRGLTAPKHKFGAVNPRVGPASKQPLMPISSSTLSSLPPSVAAFYESEQRQQQHHQQHAVGPGSALNRHLNGIKFSHRQQLAQQQAQQHGRNPSPSADSNLARYLQANGGSAAGELLLLTGAGRVDYGEVYGQRNAINPLDSMHSWLDQHHMCISLHMII